MKAFCIHGRRWFQDCDKCDWTGIGLWSKQPEPGDDILEDVIALINTLHRDRTYRPDPMTIIRGYED